MNEKYHKKFSFLPFFCLALFQCESGDGFNRSHHYEKSGPGVGASNKHMRCFSSPLQVTSLWLLLTNNNMEYGGGIVRWAVAI